MTSNDNIWPEIDQNTIDLSYCCYIKILIFRAADILCCYYFKLLIYYAADISCSWWFMLSVLFQYTSDSDSDSSLSRRNSTASQDFADGPLVITEIGDIDRSSSVDLDKALGDVPLEPSSPSPSSPQLVVPVNGTPKKKSSGRKVH